MRAHWPIILLAIGLGALHLAITSTFGAAAASAVVAAAGIAYAGLNFLLGRPRDAVETREGLARFLATSRVTYFAVGLVWLAAVGVAAAPSVDAMLSEEFTIAVVDELRRPVGDAQVTVRFGSATRRVPLQKGVGTVKYYPWRTPSTTVIVVDNKGVEQSITHRADARGRYADLTIPVWSGEPPLSVAHLTASGVAIGGLLRGDLPPDLRERYPLVTVLRTPAFDAAQQFLQIYPRFEVPDLMGYARTETDGGKKPRTSEANSFEGAGERWLKAFGGRMRTLPDVMQLVAIVELDFSRQLLGAPVGQPLPSGFLARMNAASDWFDGAEAIPDAATDAWLRRSFPNLTRGPRDTIAFRLERMLTKADLAFILARARKGDDDGSLDPHAEAYLRYMVGQDMPDGLVRGILHLDPNDGCAGHGPHIELHLPEPELRVTLLKNEGDRPLKIDEFVLAVQDRDRLQRAEEPAAQREKRVPFDMLAPGAAILVPRDLSIRSIYSEAERAELQAPDSGPVAKFRLAPRATAEIAEAVEAGLPPPPTVTPFQGQPGAVMLSGARARATRDPMGGSGPGDSIGSIDRLFAQRGPRFLVGPSIADLGYVINGVHIKARSDRRTVIAMIGQYEAGSCPFVFVRFRGGGESLNLGQIITNRIGRRAQGLDRMTLSDPFTAIELRELEYETTYVDSASIVVRRAGKMVRYPALGRALTTADGRYQVMRRGDRLPLRFEYARRDGDGEAVLEVNGYYDPAGRNGRR